MNSLRLMGLSAALACAASSLGAQDAYWHLRGTLNNSISISADLNRHGNSFFGAYYYEKVGIAISLAGEIRGNALDLDESSPNENFSDYSQTGTFSGNWDGSRYAGTWKNAAGTKSFPFDLKVDYSLGSMGFEVISDNEIRPLKPGLTREEDPKGTFYYLFSYPKTFGNPAVLQKVQRALMETGFGKLAVTGSVSGSLKKSKESFFQDYVEANGEAELEGDDGYMYTWEMNRSIVVEYNAHEILSVSDAYYEYSGGAHGMFGTGHQVYDLRTGAALKLADIFADGTEEAVNGRVETALRKAYGLAGDAPLSEILFEDYLYATENFFVNQGGIGFVYPPYEVAPYAAGEITVFVKWKDLQDIVSSDSPIRRLWL